jgi:hypothetical protein
MSKKINMPALAALLVVVVAVPGPVFAQSFRDGASHTQLQRFKRQVPSNAFGSVAGPAPHTVVSPRERRFETDPDPNVRFEMNRDDRDRRAGAS